MASIKSYNEDRDAYFSELKEAIDDAVAALPFVDDSDSDNGKSQWRLRRDEARKQAVLKFQNEQGGRYDNLELRYKSLRSSLTTVAEKQTDRKTGRPLNADTLLRQYSASMEEFETFGREAEIYTHYRVAMLQPGLSAEQRRLLFGYALAGLAQPLPFGEIMPRSGDPAPRPTQ